MSTQHVRRGIYSSELNCETTGRRIYPKLTLALRCNVNEFRKLMVATSYEVSWQDEAWMSQNVNTDGVMKEKLLFVETNK